MDTMEAEGLLKKLDRRVERIEQFLPTLAARDEMHAAIREAVAPLATRDEMHAAIREAVAPLASREELRAAIAPLATREEMKREAGETRRHFDVVAEGLRDDIRLIAENQIAMLDRLDSTRKEVAAVLDNHERRLTRLEAGGGGKPVPPIRKPGRRG
jgi:hypothetical protein